MNKEAVPAAAEPSAPFTRTKWRAGVGERLREARAARGMSLRQLARALALSPSLLSQIENGRVNPSVETLYQLAAGLDMNVADFFGTDGHGAGAAPAERAAQLVRRADRGRLELQHGVVWENLLPTDERDLQFVEVHYPPGASSGEQLVRHPGRDLILVLRGRLSMQVAFSQYQLEPGDAISYAEFTPHQLRNEGSEEMVAVCVVVGGTPAHGPLP
jgi:transcriptional regulator with XRE-family HTH domain